jgi:hypothetical protein
MDMGLAGVMEYWSVGVMEKRRINCSSILQYSNTPLLQCVLKEVVQ